MSVFALAGSTLPCSRVVRLRAALLLVDRSVVNLAHHQSDHEGVNAGNGAACVVSGDGDGCS